MLFSEMDNCILQKNIISAMVACKEFANKAIDYIVLRISFYFQTLSTMGDRRERYRKVSTADSKYYRPQKTLTNIEESMETSCVLCSDNKTAEWHCTDCAQSLCDSCKVLHLKSTACSRCFVVPVQNKRICSGFNRDNCIYHPAEPCNLFCHSCNMTVCQRCSTSRHYRHTFMNLTEVCFYKKKNLHKKIDTIRKEDIPTIKANAEKVYKNAESYSQMMQTLMYEVFKRHETWKQKAEEIRDKLILDLQKCANDDLETISRAGDALEHAGIQMQILMDNLEREMESRTGKQLVNFCDDAEKRLESMKVSVPRKAHLLKPPKFVTTDFSNSLMTRQFGHLEHQKRLILPKETEKKKGLVSAVKRPSYTR